MAVTLRSVVYGARGSYEHLARDAERSTLCGKPVEHVNPGAITRLPAPTDRWSSDYCRRCLVIGRRLLEA